MRRSTTVMAWSARARGPPYLPFGAGRHRCIGEQFANVQLQTIVAMVVREFKFRNVDGSSNVIGTDYSSLFSRPLEPANNPLGKGGTHGVKQ